MKKMICSTVVMMLFITVSMGNIKKNHIRILTLKENKNTEIIRLKYSDKTENVDLKFNEKCYREKSDFAGFVCWLFNMHCQPI
ncbi:hypothetical protein D0809_12180 [Flavobacterium circumlabens]|uniref:Uncharacterized protein n=2 Tax=Flavobacterium circumlabens TaxID=2133765 RepID=A0A4Y7UDT3_9FLAO|nr:hypothetical protein [Flavobacterium circumlabens]TEB44494.1 hypothetical protein D0809_12180 [Flavobacterium circumlabens]